MGWRVYAAMLATLLLGMDLVKWFWGLLLVVLTTPQGEIPAIRIMELPWMLALEMIFVFACMGIIFVFLAKRRAPRVVVEVRIILGEEEN